MLDAMEVRCHIASANMTRIRIVILSVRLDVEAEKLQNLINKTVRLALWLTAPASHYCGPVQFDPRGRRERCFMVIGSDKWVFLDSSVSVHTMTTGTPKSEPASEIFVKLIYFLCFNC